MADFSALKAAIQAVIKQNGNQEITGPILQEVLLSMVNTMGDGAINSLVSALSTETTNRQNADGTLQSNINNEATARQNADAGLQNSINSLQTAVNSINTRLAEGYVYVGIATAATNPGTPAGKVFYIATAAGTYTNFSSLAVTQGITILKYNGTAWSQDNLLAIDNVPKKNGTNMVTSGGIFANIGAFDISEYHKSGSTLATYADLTAALAALPSDYQKGGMSVKFVLTSDNKYVQARCMAQNFTTDVTQWQGVDDEPTVGSDNLVKSGGVEKDLTFLNNKLGEEVTFENAEPVLSITENSYVDSAGNIISSGSTSSTSYDVVEFSVENCKKVIFVGLLINSASGTVGYSFYNSNGDPVSPNKWDYDTSISEKKLKTYTLDVPSTAVTFKVSRNKKDFDISSYYYYTAEGNSVTDIINEKKDDVIEYVNSQKSVRPLISFIGNGQTYSSSIKLYGAKIGSEYRFYIDDTNIDMSGITTITTQTRFGIISVNSNNENTQLARVNLGTDLSPYYDVVIPDDSSYLLIGGRCAIGSIFKCFVESLDDSHAIDENTNNISELDREINGVEGEETTLDISTGTEYTVWPAVDTWNNTGSYEGRKIKMLSVPSGYDTLKIVEPLLDVPNTSKASKLVFLKSTTPPVNGAAIDFCSGETIRDIAVGNNTYKIPSDCVAIAIGTYIPTNVDKDVTPSSVSVITDETVGLKEKVSKNTTDIEELQSECDNSYGCTISKFETEKMAHVSNIEFTNGYFYIPYTANEVNKVETYTDMNGFNRLAVVSLCNLSQPKWYDIAKAGQTIGGITLQAQLTPPYTPTIKIKGDYAYCIFRACVDGEVTFLCRRFVLASQEFENTLTVLTLDGDPFTTSKILSTYNSLSGASVQSLESRGGDCNGAIILASDGYYYTATGARGVNFYGLIYRSQDLLNWESVAAQNLNLGTYGCDEISVVEIESNKLLISQRDSTNGIILRTYDITNHVWSNYKIIPNSQVSRPWGFVYNGDCYVAVNVNGTDVTIPGYGTAIRQNLAIYKVDTSLNIELIKTMHRDCSMQYPAFIVANENKLWMSFTTDTRHLDVSGKSDIELKEIFI